MARYTDEDEAYSADGCYLCDSPDPDLRSRHQLRLAKDCSLREVRAHLVGNGMRQEKAEDCCRWLAHVIEQYTGIPDPKTGAMLPWWEARVQLWRARDQIARHCYEEAPERYRRYLEGLPPAEVPGFAHIMAEQGTPFPEEPAYVPTPEETQFYDDPEWFELKED
jgi:hypothetical protein